jgi:hypothetical protein
MNVRTRHIVAGVLTLLTTTTTTTTAAALPAPFS